MKKQELLYWSKKHDHDYSRGIQREKEVGDKLGKTKEVAKADPIEMIRWKFEGDARRTKRELNLVADIEERDLRRVTNLVFNLGKDRDMEKMELLYALDHGIGPAVASTILTFFDPDNYGVFDFHVWNEVFGQEREIRYTTQNYIKLLSRSREIPARYNFQARTVEKAYFKRNYDKASSRKGTQD